MVPLADMLLRTEQSFAIEILSTKKTTRNSLVVKISAAPTLFGMPFWRRSVRKFTETIQKFREDEAYKKLASLLSEYPQHFIDSFYLSSADEDEYYDTIAENDSPQLASKTFSIVFPL